MARISGNKIALAAAFLLLAGGGLVLWLKTSPYAGLSPAAGGPPGGGQAMPVRAVVTELKPLNIWTSYSGRMAAVDYVELRPQVSGQITEVRFQDGQVVAKGDVLFVIDPRPYQANVAEAEAAVKGARSQYDLATKEAARAEELIRTQAIPKRTYDERQSAARVAKTALGAAEAALEKARIDLDHANLKAPIAGRISRAEVTVGNLVQAGAPVLATIVSNQGIYADFEVDEQTYLRNIRQYAGDRETESAIPVRLILNGGTEPAYEGYIQSFDNRIDTSSGTIRARAYFDNADGALLPGMFVTVRLGSASTEEGILLTEHAIGTDQNRKFVYVVAPDGKVSYREVRLGASVDGQRVITSGLEAGETVIVEGILKIQPDMVVAPQFGDAPPPAPPAEGQAPPPAH